MALKTRALFLLQTVNAVLAGACVPLVERALRRRGASTESAVAWALAFAFAATWWKFSTDANAYIPAILLVLCANDLLETRRSAWLAGFAHAAAMLFHELAVLYLVVALVRLKTTRRALAYAAAAVAPAAAVYLLAYRTVSGGWDLASFHAWLTTHSPDSGFSFNAIGDLGLTLRGTLRLFFGGQVAGPWAVAGVAAGVLAVGLAAWRWWPRTGGQAKAGAALPDVIWLGVYAAFLFFWMPQNTFYRLFYLAPLVWLAGARTNRFLPRLLCLVLLVWNAAFVIYPQSRVEKNVPLRFALEQRDRWPSGTPIAFHQFQSDLWTISYFNPQVSWIGMPVMDVAVLESARAEAGLRGQPLWLEATAYDAAEADEAGRRWLVSHPVTNMMRFRDPKHEYRFYEVR